MSSLYSASVSGDADTVRRLLGNGVDVNEVHDTSRYRTPLIVAAANGHDNIVDLLLKANANIDAELTGQGSALLHASYARHVTIVRALVAAGADFHTSQRAYGTAQTPLQLACARGNTEVAELFLDSGEEINPPPPIGRQNNHTTPLYEAAKSGFPNTVAMLVLRGADVNATSHPGSYNLSPLYAVTSPTSFDYSRRGDFSARDKEEVRYDIFQLLVDAGASLDDAAAFYQAASLGQNTIVRSMIDAGIDVNDSWFGNNPLAAAAGNGHIETVSMLVHAGADVNNTGGEQPHALLQAINEENEAMVQLLIEAGADMDCRSNEFFDFTPLQFAASRGAPTIVGMLLAAGAAVDREERDPLMYDLADEGGEQMPDDPPTPLCLAASNNHVEIVNMLIYAGADVNADTGAALAAAIRSGNDEIVRLLLRHGAAVELLHEGGSPLY